MNTQRSHPGCNSRSHSCPHVAGSRERLLLWIAVGLGVVMWAYSQAVLAEMLGGLLPRILSVFAVLGMITSLDILRKRDNQHLRERIAELERRLASAAPAENAEPEHTPTERG